MASYIVKSENNKINIIFEGKIDLIFANENSEAIIANFNNESEVIFDFDKVDYISSAGLRLVLRTAKIVKEFSVINVNRNVYDIFDISGFTSIVNIKKALRVISVEGKEVIGEGANGKVYRLDPDTICKAFKDASHIKDIENEIAMAKKAFVKGIPTAIPFDVVRLSDGGYGCVYELLKSDTMNKLIVKNPEKLDVYINMYANVLKTFLNSHIEEGELPRQSDYAKTWCKYFRENKVFDEKVCDQIDKLVHSIPEKDAIVHGDFHLKNLMFQGEEPIIIDMDTLGTGHPIYELGYLYYSLVIFDKLHPDNTLKFFEITYETSCDICKKTLDIVLVNKTEEEKKEIIEKLKLLGYLRMSYRSYQHLPIKVDRLEDAKKYVNEHIFDFDSLDFTI